MNKSSCDKIIDLFEAILLRPVMYIANSADYGRMIYFLTGFYESLNITNQNPPTLADIREAYSVRGWHEVYFGAVNEMKIKGFSDDEITRELVSVEIELWKSFRDSLEV